MTPTDPAGAVGSDGLVSTVGAWVAGWLPLDGVVEVLPEYGVWAIGALALVQLLWGGRLDDDGATLGTALCGGIVGAAAASTLSLDPVGIQARALGGALLGATVALWLDAVAVRVGLFLTGAIAGVLTAELVGAPSVSPWLALVGLVGLPWVHAPFSRAASAGVAALVLGWTRAVPAGAAGVIAVWGAGLAFQIWMDGRRQSRHDVRGADVAV